MNDATLRGFRMTHKEMRSETMNEAKWSWDWADGGVSLLRDGNPVATVDTAFPSRDGLRLADLAREHQPARIQVSDHGAGQKSVQFFAADETMICDYNWNSLAH